MAKSSNNQILLGSPKLSLPKPDAPPPLGSHSTPSAFAAPVPSSRSIRAQSECNLYTAGTSLSQHRESVPQPEAKLGHFHSIPFSVSSATTLHPSGIGNKTAIYCRYMSTAGSSPVTIVIIFIPYGTSLRQLFHLFVFGERIPDFFFCWPVFVSLLELVMATKTTMATALPLLHSVKQYTKMGTLADSLPPITDEGRVLEGYLWMLMMMVLVRCWCFWRSF